MTVVYSEWEYPQGKRCLFELTTEGELFMTRQGGKPIKQDWFTNEKTGKGMIPAKRRSFISLLRMALRDGDYDL